MKARAEKRSLGARAGLQKLCDNKCAQKGCAVIPRTPSDILSAWRLRAFELWDALLQIGVNPFGRVFAQEGLEEHFSFEGHPVWE